MPAKSILVCQRDALWINNEIRVLIEKITHTLTVEREWTHRKKDGL